MGHKKRAPQLRYSVFGTRADDASSRGAEGTAAFALDVVAFAHTLQAFVQ